MLIAGKGEIKSYKSSYCSDKSENEMIATLHSGEEVDLNEYLLVSKKEYKELLQFKKNKIWAERANLTVKRTRLENNIKNKIKELECIDMKLWNL